MPQGFDPNPARRSSSPAPTQPALRLVGREQPRPAAPAVESRRSAPGRSTTTNDEPRLAPSDPRWVLAQRAAESLEGALLPADRRERLLRLGRALGLTTFDANLILAIVQDRARRGVPARLCPAHSAAQLAQVTPPQGARRKPQPLALAVMTAGLLLAQAGLVVLLLNR
ncbi:MAG: hypothetical protein AAF612_11305 [Planctomycetota bacterium]